MRKEIVLLLTFMLSASVNAQSKVGMHLGNDGVWEKPTFQSALEALESDYQPTIAVLRQRFDTMPASELDAFADELGRLMREGTPSQASKARMALLVASELDGSDGTAYRKASNVFIRLYESYDDRLSMEASSALLGVFQAGGAEYVRDLFENSEQPKTCQYCGGLTGVDCDKVNNPCPNTGTWCQAGGILAKFDGTGPPSLELWSDLCYLPRF